MLAKDGVVVTTICPGLMRTGSPRNAMFKGRHREEYAWFEISGSVPLVSMSAERAGRQIVDACGHGDGLKVGAPMKLAATLAAVAVGQHGSIAVIERFIRTLTSEGTRRFLVPAFHNALRRELLLFVGRYNEHRPP